MQGHKGLQTKILHKDPVIESLGLCSESGTTGSIYILHLELTHLFFFLFINWKKKTIKEESDM